MTTEHGDLPNQLRQISFQQLADVMPQMVWSTLPDGAHDYYNAQWYAFTGAPVGSTDGEGWNGMFHPDDQERAWKRWRHSLATGDPYEIEYRLRRHDGVYRWTLGRALPVRDEGGTIIRWVGTCTDIDDQKRIAEHNEVLSRELSHRIKNIFAVIGSLISMSARQAPEHRDFATRIRQRIQALGRAHDYVRPAEGKRRTGLHGMLADLFSPYGRGDGAKVAVNGDDVTIAAHAATPLALVFHELATNAGKYGAFSSPRGFLQVSWTRLDDRLKLTWDETEGPPIEDVGKPGFGTKLLGVALSPFDGKTETSFLKTGIHCTMQCRIPPA